MRDGLRGRRHLGRGPHAQGEGREHRTRRGQTGKLPSPLSGPLGLEIPESAVERIARRARAQLAGDADAVERPLNGAQALERALDRLAVAGVGHRLPATLWRPSDTRASTTIASDLAPRAMTNGFASGHASWAASISLVSACVMTAWERVPPAMLAEPAARMPQEQIDAARVGDQVALGQLAGGIAHVRFGDGALEVGEIAGDGARRSGSMRSAGSRRRTRARPSSL